MRLHRTWTNQSFQFQRSTDLPILAQRAPNRPLLQLADHLLHPADHTLHGPNRPLLQLADHLLHPADHTLHLFQQTIVTAGRPFLTPSRPYPPSLPMDHCYSWQTLCYTQQTIPSIAPNRPSLQLADHLLQPADHINNCSKQTIVTAGRPFVTPSRPYK